MKKFMVVSTYPALGSKNIGDQLITNSLINLVRDICPESVCDVVFRADDWSSVKGKIYQEDHILFACLAIRPNMIRNYPYLRNIIESGIPFSVIAAGTDLPIHESKDIYSGWGSENLELLREIDEKAIVFTTRGALTQFFCKSIGLKKARLDGDVAFYGPEQDSLKFQINKGEIKSIVISDPHMAELYVDAVSVLFSGLKKLFPSSKIVFALHGVNFIIEEWCMNNKIEFLKIYEDKDSGLDIYDECDLHVGFRVHAHVSALKRRKYSYLLEQDGRGSDYGATIEKKISLPNHYVVGNPVFEIKNLARFFLGKPLSGKRTVSISPACQILAMLDKDNLEDFVKFLGLERQINRFNEATCKSISRIVDTM